MGPVKNGERGKSQRSMLRHGRARRGAGQGCSGFRGDGTHRRGAERTEAVTDLSEAVRADFRQPELPLPRPIGGGGFVAAGDPTAEPCRRAQR